MVRRRCWIETRCTFMLSVTDLSFDIRRAWAAASALTGLSTIIVALTFGVGHAAVTSYWARIDVQAVALVLICCAASIVTAIALALVRSHIFLRASVWVEHAFASHHYASLARQTSKHRGVLDDEFAIQAISNGLKHGLAGRSCDATWLPAYWIALSSVSLWHGAVALIPTLAIIAVARLTCRNVPNLQDVRLSGSIGANRPSTVDIAAWERSHRSVTSMSYAFAILQARLRATVGCVALLSLGLVGVGLTMSSLLGELHWCTACCLALLHARSIWISHAFAVGHPDRCIVDRVTKQLIRARAVDRRTDGQTTDDQTHGTNVAHLNRTVERLRHAA
jgi:hypothetical protein